MDTVICSLCRGGGSVLRNVGSAIFPVLHDEICTMCNGDGQVPWFEKELPEDDHRKER